MRGPVHQPISVTSALYTRIRCDMQNAALRRRVFVVGQKLRRSQVIARSARPRRGEFVCVGGLDTAPGGFVQPADHD
jgi:hypothetical protein